MRRIGDISTKSQADLGESDASVAPGDRYGDKSSPSPLTERLVNTTEESSVGIQWWRSVDGQPLWQEWLGTYSIFNAETGETHLISELPAAVLRRLATEALPLRHLAADLAESCSVEMTTTWEQKVSGVLTNLEHIELVEQVPTERV